MAVLKIQQAEGKINTGNVPRSSALALPLSIANQQAQGFKAFSDGMAIIALFSERKIGLCISLGCSNIARTI